MATNFHSTLPNDQIHLPKDFSTASASSIMCKDKDSQIQWPASQFNLSTEITCAGDVAANLHNTAFILYYSKYYAAEVSIGVTGSTPAYTPLYPLYAQVNVTIAANDTAPTVASAIKTAIDNLSTSDPNFDFTVGILGAKLVVSGMDNAPKPEDLTTSFAFSTTKTFYGQQVLQADTDGSISFKGMPFEREFQLSATPLLNNANIWVQKSTHSVGSMALDTGITPPAPPHLPLRHALGGAIYHASKGDTFANWKGVIGGVATFTLALLRVTNDCTHATANNGDIIVFQNFTLTDADWGVCFDLNASFTFEEADLVVPVVYSTTLPGIWHGTSRIKINRI